MGLVENYPALQILSELAETKDTVPIL